jgi:hypothetical protein
LDNPGWYLYGDGQIKNGGYAFFNAPKVLEQRDGDEVRRYLSTNCSYTERVELRDVKMNASLVRFDHGPTSTLEGFGLTISFGDRWFRFDIEAKQLLFVIV